MQQSQSTIETINPIQKQMTLACKVAFIGDTNVGKTSLVNKLLQRNFSSNHPTIGTVFDILNTVIDNSSVKFHIWDTAGQERFHSIVPMYIRDTHIIVMVFDLNSKTSFDNIKNIWIKTIKQSCGGNDINDNGTINNNTMSSQIVLVGNKSDLCKECTFIEDVNEFCKSTGIYFTQARYTHISSHVT